MKVYIIIRRTCVNQDEYFDDIEGVYSTPEKAEKRAEELNEYYGSEDIEYFVSGHPVE